MLMRLLQLSFMPVAFVYDKAYMIATLEGKVSDKSTDVAVIDCGGVGYGVYITSDDHGSITLGQSTKLYIYEHIREASHDLFGFTSPSVKKLFEQLLGVNGVGPKMAMAILNVGNPDQVRQAISTGDTKYISQANGVGKRVAERVVVDLKDKLGLAAADDATSFLNDQGMNNPDEAVQALVALGYTSGDAIKALSNIDASLSTEERVKQALSSR